MELSPPDHAVLRDLAHRPAATIADLRRSPGVDVATRRWLIGVVMSLWLGAGLLDWRFHRRAKRTLRAQPQAAVPPTETLRIPAEAAEARGRRPARAGDLCW
jgi:hypothetical protein